MKSRERGACSDCEYGMKMCRVDERSFTAVFPTDLSQLAGGDLVEATIIGLPGLIIRRAVRRTGLYRASSACGQQCQWHRSRRTLRPCQFSLGVAMTERRSYETSPSVRPRRQVPRPQTAQASPFSSSTTSSTAALKSALSTVRSPAAHLPIDRTR